MIGRIDFELSCAYGFKENKKLKVVDGFMDETKRKPLKEMICEIINEAYLEENPTYPNQKIISEKVRCMKNREIDPNWEDTYEYESQNRFFKSCQSIVSRCLKKLREEKVVYRLADDTYVPYNLEVARNELKSTIVDTIYFNRCDVFVFSSHYEIHNENTSEEFEYCTYSILVDVRYDCINKAKDLFRQYIGNVNYYDITEFQGKILVMIEGRSTEIEKLRFDFSDMAKAGFDKKEIIPRRSIKI